MCFQVDSYSVFNDNGGFTKTELDVVLAANNIDVVFIVGLATDYCVYYTAQDAMELGRGQYFCNFHSRTCKI